MDAFLYNLHKRQKEGADMNRIKELRLSRGLGQKELGEMISAAYQTVGNYERGDRDPDLKTINALCDIFGVTADYLLGRSAAPTFDLTDEEWEIIASYRELSPDGKAYVLHGLALASLGHSGKNRTVPDVEGEG